MGEFSTKYENSPKFFGKVWSQIDMKKTLAFLLAAVMLLSLVGCAVKSSHAEDFLIAARTLDLDAMSTHVFMSATSSSVPLVEEKHYAAMLGEQKMSVLISLYSMLQYTMGEEFEVEDGTKTIAVTLKTPDFARIRSLVQTKLLVSGASAEELLGKMIESGEIAKSYMKEKNLKVKVAEKDGEFYVLYNERDNAELLEALSFIETLRFLAMN